MGRRREPEVDRGIYLEVTREETDERRDREIGDAQGVSAPTAADDGDVFSLLHRPHQCQFRGADDEQGHRADSGRLWFQLNRLLCRLRPLRGSKQPGHGQGWRPTMAGQDHGELGPCFKPPPPRWLDPPASYWFASSWVLAKPGCFPARSCCLPIGFPTLTAAGSLGSSRWHFPSRSPLGLPSPPPS